MGLNISPASVVFFHPSSVFRNPLWSMALELWNRTQPLLVLRGSQYLTPYLTTSMDAAHSASNLSSLYDLGLLPFFSSLLLQLSVVPEPTVSTGNSRTRSIHCFSLMTSSSLETVWHPATGVGRPVHLRTQGGFALVNTCSSLMFQQETPLHLRTHGGFALVNTCYSLMFQQETPLPHVL